MPSQDDLKQLQLLVVIINYKTPEMVKECLETLFPELDTSAHVAVVDNDSADGSAEDLAGWLEHHPYKHQCTLVRSDTNRGFSGGNNVGIRLRRADYYLLLNSDTLVRPGAIATLLQTAGEELEAGLVAPRLEWPDGTPQISCFRFQSPASEFIHSARTGLVTRMLSGFDIPIPVSNGRTYPQWASFACILIKKAVFDDVGLMDEGYFLYYEDSDFCRMAAEKGWRVCNEPSAHVVHLRGGSSEVKSNTERRERLPRYWYESRTRYFCKHYGVAGLVVANCLWHAGRCISFTREMLERRATHVCKKQSIDIWTNVTDPLNKKAI